MSADTIAKLEIQKHSVNAKKSWPSSVTNVMKSEKEDLEKDTPAIRSNEKEKNTKHDTKSEGDNDNSVTSNIGENNISVRVSSDVTPSTSGNKKVTIANSSGPSTPQNDER